MLKNLSDNISIYPFKYKYLEHLIDMLKSQQYLGISDITMRTLPKTGYIVMLNDQPIAAGFLRRVEPCYAQLDTLVSNAYLGSVVRHHGIQMVVDALLADAKRLKLEGIISFTSDQGILTRAESMGFHKVPQTIIALSLHEKA